MFTQYKIETSMMLKKKKKKKKITVYSKYISKESQYIRKLALKLKQRGGNKCKESK